MKQAKAVGVAGLVVGGIHDEDLRALLGYDLGVAITGTEQVGFTLILTEGFGTIPMAAKTFKLLVAHAGRQASISGATQIRAGVIRPEVIVPDATPVKSAAGSNEMDGILRGRLRDSRDSGALLRADRPLYRSAGRISGAEKRNEGACAGSRV